MNTLRNIARLATFAAPIVAVLFVVAAASAQWLDNNRQAGERKLWESTGVPWIEGAKFYELPKLSQRLVGIVGYSPENRYGLFDETYQGAKNVNAQLPWVTPAGLHWTERKQWRKASAAYFPGDIAVWVERVMVENSIRKPGGGFFTQPQPHVKWSFPDGTVFAEMLIRRLDSGAEQVFEIRTREKRDGKWGDGTTYRPFADSAKLPVGTRQSEMQVPPGKLTDFGFDWADVTVHTLPAGAAVPAKLVPSRLTVAAADTGSALPVGYLGNVRTCADCHKQAGKPTSYGATTIRGSDTVLSWFPFKTQNVNTDAMPVLDERWGIRRK